MILTKVLYVSLLKAIRDQVLNCGIVSIYVDDKDQANEIFENINSKGKPLSQIDLIKNYVFSVIPLSSAGVDNAQIKWNEMKRKISSSSSDYSNYSLSFDDFFVDYLKAKYPNIRLKSKNIYSSFRKYFNTKEKVTNFLKDITSDIELYIKIINPKIDDYPRKEKQPIFYALQAISRFKGKQVRIPLMSLLITEKTLSPLSNDKQKASTRKHILDIISYLSLFHFAVFGLDMKFRSNQLSKPFADFSLGVINSSNSNDVGIEVSKLKMTLFQLVSKDSFIENFVKLSFEKAEARTSLATFPTSFALNSIENKKSSRGINHPDSSIEHIIDESDSPNQSIGNLVVLEQKINEEIEKNKKSLGRMLSFSEKSNYYKKSQFSMVKDLIGKYGDFETENAKSRAIELAEYFYESVLKV